MTARTMMPIRHSPYSLMAGTRVPERPYRRLVHPKVYIPAWLEMVPACLEMGLGPYLEYSSELEYASDYSTY